MNKPIKVVVVGYGNMGISHARAYHKLGDFDLVGLMDRAPAPCGRLARELDGIAEFDSPDAAIKAAEPDTLSINTYPERYYQFALKGLEADLCEAYL